eukprot:414715-Amphidinium_carterae.1
MLAALWVAAAFHQLAELLYSTRQSMCVCMMTIQVSEQCNSVIILLSDGKANVGEYRDFKCTHNSGYHQFKLS